MASFDPPEPPFEPGEPTPPPILNVPLPPPEVGFGSPFVPADAENRDRILDWWRMWWRRVFFPWVTAFTEYWGAQWDRLAEYVNTWITAADEYITEHAIAGYSWRTTATPINTTVGQTTAATFTGVDQEHRPLVVGDLVSDQTFTKTFGIITALIDATHATVTTIGQLSGFNGHGWWVTATAIAHGGTTPVVLVAEVGRPPQVGDFVMDQTASVAYGIVTIVTDNTHVTVNYIGTLQGPQGIQGIPGPQGDPGVVQSIVAGAFITVDDTDPANPIVSGTSGGGGVDSVVAGDNVTVDDTDPANPIVSATNGGGVVETIVAGDNVTVDDTDPANPIVSASGGGGAVESVVAGDNVTVDNTDPANPIVNASGVVETIVAGDGVTVDDTDPANPIVSASGGGGGVESVVAGDRITVDDTDPANPIVSTENGIPLNVFPTIDRPAALVDGDAYFDSTLIIPVWSYGSVWRDSEGTVIPDPPDLDTDDLDNDGGSFGGLVGAKLFPESAWQGFDWLQYVERAGVLYGGVSPSLHGGTLFDHVLVRFDGHTYTPVVNPGSITLQAYTCSYVWMVSGLIYVLISTADDAFGSGTPQTWLFTFDGAEWVEQDISPELSEGFMRNDARGTSYGNGVLYFYGIVNSETTYWYIPDVEIEPEEVFGEGGHWPLEQGAQNLNGSLIAWDETNNVVVKFVEEDWDSDLPTSFLSAANFQTFADANGINQGVIVFDGEPGGNASRLYLTSGYTDALSPMGHFLNRVGLQGNGTIPVTVYVADPSDPTGDHVSFRVTIGGTPTDVSAPVYLAGNVYVIVYDGTNDYQVKIAASV